MSSGADVSLSRAMQSDLALSSLVMGGRVQDYLTSDSQPKYPLCCVTDEGGYAHHVEF